MRITANNISLVSVLGIMTGAVYLLICIFYGVFARQNILFFVIPFLFNLALLVWRAVRFLPAQVSRETICRQLFSVPSSTLRLAVAAGPGSSSACSVRG